MITMHIQHNSKPNKTIQGHKSISLFSEAKLFSWDLYLKHKNENENGISKLTLQGDSLYLYHIPDNFSNEIPSLISYKLHHCSHS